MADKNLLISVPEQEFKGLLQRDKILSAVQQLSPWTALMRDLVNYGTNLVPRCFGTSSRTLADAVLTGVLLRQVISMLDGAEVLLSSGAVHAAKLQMRALLEAALYLDWIRVSDSEKKADYYYVHNLRRQRRWAERVQGTSNAGREFVEMMNAIGVPPKQEVIDLAKQHLAEIQRVLAQPRFAATSADFDARLRGKLEVPWYSPLGPRNLREIAKAVGKLPHYLLWYSLASDVIHGSNYRDHLTFGSGRVTFEPIRYLKDFDQVYHFSVIMALDVYTAILERYRSGELPAFSRKYVEKWQKVFMNTPNITINVEEITI